MPYLDRASFIALLEQLGADSSADALAAARDIHRRITDAGLEWDALLDQGPNTDGDTDGDADAVPGDFEISDRHGDHSFEQQDPVPPGLAALYAEELALLDSLLARTGLAAETRRELLDLRTDIASNELADIDRAYLRTLVARLNGKNPSE
ncbi:MAG: hypothetical protein WCK65_04915 [Rhodospirillaceae bacterium]